MATSASCVPVRGGGVYPLILATGTGNSRERVYCAVDGGKGNVKWFSERGDAEGVGVASQELINLRSASLNSEGVLAFATESSAGIVDKRNDVIVAIPKPTNLPSNVIPEYTSVSWSPCDCLLSTTHKAGLVIYKFSNERSGSPELLAQSPQQKPYLSSCWLSSSVLLTSSTSGVQLIDTRSSAKQVSMSTSSVPSLLYNLSYNNRNLVAGVAIATDAASRGSSYFIQLFDVRKMNSPQTRPIEEYDVTATTVLGKAGLRAFGQYSFISGASWSACGNHLLVTPVPSAEVQNTFQAAGIVETFDVETLIKTYTDESSTSQQHHFVKGRSIRAISDQPIAGAAFCGVDKEQLECVSVARNSCSVSWFVLQKRKKFISVIQQSSALSQPVSDPTEIVNEGSEPVMISWSPSSTDPPTDISTLMIDRSPASFGCSRQGVYDAFNRQGDLHYIQFGYWFAILRRLCENYKSMIGKKIFLPGMLTIVTDYKNDLTENLLKETTEERKERDKAGLSDSLQISEGSPQGPSSSTAKTVLEQQFKVYDSPWRKIVRVLVGWQPLSSITECGSLSMKMVTAISPVGFTQETIQFERTVACRVLQLKLSEAIDLLTQQIQRREQSKSLYSLLVLALSSVSIGTCHAVNSWNDLISNISFTPTLVASLQFLSSWNVRPEESTTPSLWAKYSCVLDTLSVDVVDKIGFASTYLDDDAVESYFQELSTSNLHPLTSVILNGVSDTNTDGLVRFLDATGDIQLTTITALAAMPYNHELTQKWVKHYRDFVLKSCGPTARCQMEIILSGLKSQEVQVTPVQPTISLHHTMGKRSLDSKKVLRMQRHISHLKEPAATGPLASSSRDSRKVPFLQAQCSDCRTILAIPHRAASHSDKIGVCSKCFAPLPKCSICLQVTGSSTDSLPAHLTWCLTCKHGGHLDHLQNWFAVHKQCPVADCTCNCASLDG